MFASYIRAQKDFWYMHIVCIIFLVYTAPLWQFALFSIIQPQGFLRYIAFLLAAGIFLSVYFMWINIVAARKATQQKWQNFILYQLLSIALCTFIFTAILAIRTAINSI